MREGRGPVRYADSIGKGPGSSKVRHRSSMWAPSTTMGCAGSPFSHALWEACRFSRVVPRPLSTSLTLYSPRGVFRAHLGQTPAHSDYHLTQCGRAHDCQAKGRRFTSRLRRFFSLHPTCSCGLCGYLGRNPGEGVKLGRNPRKVR